MCCCAAAAACWLCDVGEVKRLVVAGADMMMTRVSTPGHRDHASSATLLIGTMGSYAVTQPQTGK